MKERRDGREQSKDEMRKEKYKKSSCHNLHTQGIAGMYCGIYVN